MRNEALHKAIAERMVSPQEICIWYLGQEGFAVKTAGAVLVVDPYLSDSIDRDMAGQPGFRRNYPPPVQPRDMRFADLILCTHDHQDHLDPDTLRDMNSGKNRFGCPAPAVNSLLACGIHEGQLCRLKQGEALHFPGGQMLPIPAAHDRFHTQNGDYCELSFLFLFDNGLRLFHGGDMMIYPELEEQLKEYSPHLVLLPINGRCHYRELMEIVGNINFTEAADFAGHVGARMLIPMHYDLYEANGENPAYLVDYLRRRHPLMQCHLFAPGGAMALNAQDWLEE